MAEELLEIGARVETAAIATGMQQSAQAVQAATQQMSEGFGRVRQASMQTTEGFGTVRVSAQQVTQALNQVEAATKRVAAVGAPALRWSQQMTQANNELAESSHAVVSGQQATSAAIKTLEGNAGLRAVENFIAKTLGLGPAMQAIFPIIGGLAFGKILFDIGEKAYEVEQKAAHAADAIGDAYGAMHEKAVVSNDDLAITAARLQIEIDKLEGHPQNGLALALAEGKKYGDELLVTLRADRKELDDLLKEHDVGAFGSALSGVESTATQHKQLIADQRQLADAVSNANTQYNIAAASAKGDDDLKRAAATRDTAIRNFFQRQIDAYRSESARLKSTNADSRPFYMKALGLGSDDGDSANKVANIEGRTGELIEMQTAATARVNIAALTARKEADTQAKELAEQQKQHAREASTAARQANEQRYRLAEENLAQMQLERVMTVGEVSLYWETVKSTFAVGSQQYIEIVKRQATLAAEAHRQIAELIKKAKAEEAKDAELGTKLAIAAQDSLSKITNETAENAARSGSRWDGYWREVAKGDEVSAHTAGELELVALRAEQASGGVSVLAVQQAEARIHTRENELALKALRLELERLQAQVGQTKGTMFEDPKLAADIKRLQNQIAQKGGEGAVQSATDQAAIARTKAAPYQAATQQISQGLSGALATWERGQGSFVSAWGRSLGNMVTTTQAHLLQMGAMWVAHYAQGLIMHTTTNTLKTASDATHAAASKSISLTQSLSQANHSAMTAATNTYASVSAIPIVGPVRAPIAAAGAYTAVLGLTALASAERGWSQVPADNTLTNLHKNEMVLPAELAGRVRSMTGSSTSVTNHFGGNTINGGGNDFPLLLDRHEDALASKMQQLYRDGRIGIPTP